MSRKCLNGSLQIKWWVLGIRYPIIPIGNKLTSCWTDSISCPSQKLKSAKKTRPSTAQHPSVIDKYLADKVSLGKVAAHFNSSPYPNLLSEQLLCYSQNGPAGRQLDLPSPRGASVNDGINLIELALHYITVDQVIRLVCRFVKGALMTKFDAEVAYCNVPVHPHVIIIC